MPGNGRRNDRDAAVQDAAGSLDTARSRTAHIYDVQVLDNGQIVSNGQSGDTRVVIDSLPEVPDAESMLKTAMLPSVPRPPIYSWEHSLADVTTPASVPRREWVPSFTEHGPSVVAVDPSIATQSAASVSAAPSSPSAPSTLAAPLDTSTPPVMPIKRHVSCHSKNLSPAPSSKPTGSVHPHVSGNAPATQLLTYPSGGFFSAAMQTRRISHWNAAWVLRGLRHFH